MDREEMHKRLDVWLTAWGGGGDCGFDIYFASGLWLLKPTYYCIAGFVA